MIKTTLIGGIFFVVFFLLLPENQGLNNLGIKIIGLYFFAGVLYFSLIVILWVFFGIKAPIESIDGFIYEKWLKKWFSKKKG
ncbi:hypothetical protein BKH46_02370 [Helicobacter sp. 12S02634-8]|uniref:hypothetical protein n=1 Tax=Helicobacter sp. 12S02634-8 TaxID=1476199 RepID=UPI000BA76505|nr:hypothetical protein [Helicobacter sp. 12S02634-8]PAF48172.1 hypothetical protein BKH46_02370 [Helicobacter sp. 12S02634-8]